MNAKQNTKYAKKTPNTPKKTPNTPKKQNMQKKHQILQIFIYAVLSQKKFVPNSRTFWCTFYRPKKYGGVPKRTNIRYDHNQMTSWWWEVLPVD